MNNGNGIVSVINAQDERLWSGNVVDFIDWMHAQITEDPANKYIGYVFILRNGNQTSPLDIHGVMEMMKQALAAMELIKLLRDAGLN